MKRKVLFLIESLSGGGAEKVLTVLLKHFDYEKYDVTICPLVDTGVYSDEVKRHVSHYCPLVSYKYGSIRNLWNRIKYKLIYSILPLSVVYKWFVPKDNDVEIAFCEGYVTKLLSKANSRAKKITWLHTDLTDNPWPVQLGIFRDDRDEKEAYSAFDRIVCVSKTVEISFHKKYGSEDRTCTIYNPIDIEDIRNKAGEKIKSKDGVFNIISIGRLVPQKGYDRLLGIVSRLHEEYPSINLLILGEGEERQKLEQYIHDNKMESYTHLPGFNRNPYKHIVNADLFVCSSRAEGFSLVIAEAMALGVPVLSTYCSGPNELLGDGEYGILVKNTEEDLYKGLKHVVSGEINVNKFSEKAKQRIREFEVVHAINRIEEVLTQL